MEGGHSLVAARLIARVEKEFDVQLSLSALFKAPTMSQLAALMVTHNWDGADSSPGNSRLSRSLEPTVRSSRSRMCAWWRIGFANPIGLHVRPDFL